MKTYQYLPYYTQILPNSLSKRALNKATYGFGLKKHILIKFSKWKIYWVKYFWIIRSSNERTIQKEINNLLSNFQGLDIDKIRYYIKTINNNKEADQFLDATSSNVFQFFIYLVTLLLQIALCRWVFKTENKHYTKNDVDTK